MFEANVSAIREQHPLLYSQLEEALHTYTPIRHQQEEGHYQFEIHSKKRGKRKTITLFPPHRLRERYFPHWRAYQPGHQWLFLFGADTFLPEVLEEKTLSERTPILMIEPNFAAFMFMLHEYDLRPLFALPNVYWHIGKQAYQHALEMMAGVLKPYFITGTGLHFIPSLQRPELLQEGQSYMRKIQQRFKHLSQEIQQRSNQFLLHYQRPRHLPTQNIMLLIPTVSCWMVLGRGLREGLKGLGYRVIEHRIPYPLNQLSPFDSLRLWFDLIENCPDCLMTLSHPSDVLIPGIESVPMPRLIWYVDDPDHLHTYHHGPHDYLFYCHGEFQARMYDRAKHHLGEVPLGGYSLTHTFREEFHCQLGFVGSIMNTEPYRQKISCEIVQKIDQAVAARQERIKAPWESILKIYELHEKEQKEILRAIENLRREKMSSQQLLYFYLNAEWVRARRLELLLSLQDYEIKIFGNPDWETLLQDTALEDAFQGKGLTSQECFDFYLSAEISLNIHPPFLHSAPATRDMEVPLCDGFVLSDMHLHTLQRTEEFFIPNHEIALYESVEDLPAKVEYYLDHPQERQAISERAKQRIEKEHGYTQRIIQLFDQFEDYRNHARTS